jgi:RNA polymerase sigma-54 factor
MKLDLQLKLRQTLAPQLIQSLKMLQLPVLKLEQMLRHELATNPLLEEIEPADDSSEEITSPTLSDEDPKLDPKMDKIDWDYYLGDEADDYTFRRMREHVEDRERQIPATDRTIHEHLLEQLSFLKLTDEEYAIGEFIIGNIDESGYLTCDAEEMAEILEIDADPIRKMIERIQGFDPSGVAARNLQESLLIQLRGKGHEGSLAYRIVEECFDSLDKKSYLQISKALGTTPERVQEAMDLLKTLSPKPTTGRFDPAALPIVPDLVVDKVGDDYVVYHNDRSVPQLRINSAYRSLLKRGNNTADGTRKYIREKLEQARWLLNAVNQRRSTMIKVMYAIVEEQIEFFERGPDYLKPLIMENIAEKVGMNVATIARVSKEKYVQTPQGVYEIKFFFNTGLPKEGGEQIVKRRVKQKLEDIIKSEDPAVPLSDQEIHKRLNDEGISIARRTVTKYREELKILPARFRKRVVKESG